MLNVSGMSILNTLNTLAGHLAVGQVKMLKVLNLSGMNTLNTLNTLAGVKSLGRVVSVVHAFCCVVTAFLVLIICPAGKKGACTPAGRKGRLPPLICRGGRPII